MGYDYFERVSKCIHFKRLIAVDTLIFFNLRRKMLRSSTASVE